MVKRTIKYTDFNGEQRVEDFYFNLTAAEVAKMEWSKSGGLSTFMKRIFDAKDVTEITKVIDQVIMEAYGEKSDDGKYFVKGKDHERARAFMETQAYSDFYFDLISRKGAMAQFFNELVPKELADKAEVLAKQVEEEEARRLEGAIGA